MTVNKSLASEKPNAAEYAATSRKGLTIRKGDAIVNRSGARAVVMWVDTNNRLGAEITECPSGAPVPRLVTLDDVSVTMWEPVEGQGETR